MPFFGFDEFLEKFIEIFILDIKVTIAEKSTEILRKFVFITMFENRQNLGKIWIV